MGALFRLIKSILLVAFVVVVLYGFSIWFMVLPQSMSPHSLFGQKYDDFKSMLAKDADSSDTTAKASKFVNDILDANDKSYESSAANSTTASPAPANQASQANNQPATAPAAAADPVSKAQETVNQFNDKIQQEKQSLDKL